MKDGVFEEYVEGVLDGFFCLCYGFKFDMVGCVFENVFVLLNLVVLLY